MVGTRRFVTAARSDTWLWHNAELAAYSHSLMGVLRISADRASNNHSAQRAASEMEMVGTRRVDLRIP